MSVDLSGYRPSAALLDALISADQLRLAYWRPSRSPDTPRVVATLEEQLIRFIEARSSLP